MAGRAVRPVPSRRHTGARLDRGALGAGPAGGRTVFDAHPPVIISTDFIKSERRRAEFVRTCPKLVIVELADGLAEMAAETPSHAEHRG